MSLRIRGRGTVSSWLHSDNLMGRSHNLHEHPMRYLGLRLDEGELVGRRADI